MTSTDDREDVVMHPLVADILTAMVDQAAYTTNTLLDSLNHQIAEANATLAAVRWRIEHLMDGDYMPTSHAILGALYPHPKAVEAHMKPPGE